MSLNHRDDEAQRLEGRLGPNVKHFAGYLAGEFWQRVRATLMADGFTLAEAEGMTRQVVAGTVSSMASAIRAQRRAREFQPPR